jgi:hypothetical protein
MQTSIPLFRYRTRQSADTKFGFIEAEGEVVHSIENLNEFHKAFGYTRDMANAGILPDEFIWEEYIKDKAESCAACYQLHIIEYLLKHSVAFFQKFGERYDDWIAAHAEAKAASGNLCVVCKAKRLEGNLA